MVKLADRARSIYRFLGGNGNGRQFTYDAVQDRQRRRPPEHRLRSEDAELTQRERGQIITGTRDLQRNFSIAAWAIRKHLDYVTRFNFQSRTGRPDFDNRFEELMRWWGRTCDVARRHPLRRIIRLTEARAVLDGDILLVKLEDGRLQAIEADRVRNATDLPAGVNTPTMNHGVQVDPAGAALAYSICRRKNQTNGFEFERMVPAEHAVLHGYFDRFDQVRGISPLTAALNSFRDIYEAVDYALAKAKITQLFALAIYRQQAEDVGYQIPEASAEGEAEIAERYAVDFGRGPFKLELAPNDRAEFLESHQPSTEFQSLIQVVTGASLKALDIPYSFFDEAYTNYSGARQALVQYEQSAEDKRQDIRDNALDPLTAWRAGMFVAQGLLELPFGWRMSDLSWEWVATGLPWIQPQQEMTADTMAVDWGLDSPQRIIKRATGAEAMEILDETGAWWARRRELGIPDPAGKSSGPAVANGQKAGGKQ